MDKRIAVLVAVFVIGGSLFCFIGDFPQGDKDKLAERLVTQCANVKEGDLVYIGGGLREKELLEDLAVEVRKAGAFPVLTFGSDRLNRLMYTEVPDKYLFQSSEPYLKLFSLFNAGISIDFNEDSKLLADIPRERIAAAGKADVPINEMLYKRSVKRVSIGNGLYPTDELAGLFGISKEKLAEIFWNGVNVDYGKLQLTADAVKKVVSSGKNVRVTSPNGTDLKLNISGRTVVTSDGTISEADIKQGGAACFIWLPAGEVYILPAAGSANGKVYVDHEFYEGQEIKGMTLEFRGGKLVSMTAQSGLEPLKAAFDAAELGKDQLAVVDIGLNPNIHIVPNSRMLSYVAEGMISVWLGNDSWAGGNNFSSFNPGMTLPSCTVEVDGKVLVKDGKLVL